MSQLSAFDRAVIEMAIRDGVLRRVCEEQIASIGGEAVVVGCADGHQSPEWGDHLTKKGLHRRHQILSNGGPLPLGPGSPAAAIGKMLPEVLEVITRDRFWLNMLVRIFFWPIAWFGKVIRSDIFLLVQVVKGLELKNMSAVVLMPHAPCGVAGICRLDIVQQWTDVVAAKKRLKKKLRHWKPTLQVMLLFHVDWGNGTKHTYYFSGAVMVDWLKSNTEAFSALKARL